MDVKTFLFLYIYSLEIFLRQENVVGFHPHLVEFLHYCQRFETIQIQPPQICGLHREMDSKNEASFDSKMIFLCILGFFDLYTRNQYKLLFPVYPVNIQSTVFENILILLGN